VKPSNLPPDDTWKIGVTKMSVTLPMAAIQLSAAVLPAAKAAHGWKANI